MGVVSGDGGVRSQVIYLPIGELNKMSMDCTWSMATGLDGCLPLIYRIRHEVPAFATKATFPNLLAVTWRFDPTTNNGMPLPEALERMLELENLLGPAFEGACQAFLTVVVTGNGVREWQWYAKSPEVVMKLVNETLGEIEPFPVQFSFQDDPAWSGYSQFLEVVRSKDDSKVRADDGCNVVF